MDVYWWICHKYRKTSHESGSWRTTTAQTEAFWNLLLPYLKKQTKKHSHFTTTNVGQSSASETHNINLASTQKRKNTETTSVWKTQTLGTFSPYLHASELLRDDNFLVKYKKRKDSSCPEWHMHCAPSSKYKHHQLVALTSYKSWFIVLLLFFNFFYKGIKCCFNVACFLLHSEHKLLYYCCWSIYIIKQRPTIY